MRSNKQYKGPGVMDLEEFQSSLFDMLDLPIWDTVAVSKFKEQAEQLFRKASLYLTLVHITVLP